MVSGKLAIRMTHIIFTYVRKNIFEIDFTVQIYIYSQILFFYNLSVEGIVKCFDQISNIIICDYINLNMYIFLI